MFNIFKHTNLPDGAMTFQEQKALAMWVRHSILIYRPFTPDGHVKTSVHLYWSLELTNFCFVPFVS